MRREFTPQEKREIERKAKETPGLMNRGKFAFNQKTGNLKNGYAQLKDERTIYLKDIGMEDPRLESTKEGSTETESLQETATE